MTCFVSRPSRIAGTHADLLVYIIYIYIYIPYSYAWYLVDPNRLRSTDNVAYDLSGFLSDGYSV